MKTVARWQRKGMASADVTAGLNVPDVSYEVVMELRDAFAVAVAFGTTALAATLVRSVIVPTILGLFDRRP